MDDDTLGARLRAARTKSGLSQLEAAYAIRDHLGRRDWVSNETIRRLEDGTIPEAKASLAVLLALAKVYKTRISDLSPDALNDIERLEVLVKSRCWSALGANGSERRRYARAG